ncbi:MAG: Rieske (2Fe-2S) protein [Bacteroidales bacterium]|nr:Rieske (2Fe-2S) protein [Bacteroidales bacterium]
MDRRNFLKSSCILCGSAFVGASIFLESCQKSTLGTSAGSVNFSIDLNQSPYTALNSPGGAVIKNNVIIVNSGGRFVALSDICTHQGCSVAYNKSSNDFVCPCHGGTYDINGNVLYGPPPAPLKKYTVTQSGSTLTIKG